MVDPLSNASVVRKMGAAVSLVFVFLYVSRVTDLAFSYLHLPFILGALAGLTAALSGNWSVGLKTRAGMLYMAMTAWILLGTPFSAWRGGSVAVITQYWLRSVLISLLVMGLVLTFKEVSRLMDAIALGVLVAAILALRAGVATVDGRLAIEGGSRIGNPNDMAFVMLLGMPLWWRNITSGSWFRRCIGIAALLPIMACFLKTGSRGGLFGLAAMLLAAFIHAPLMGKIRLAIAGVLAGVIAFAMLPPYLRQRYFTLETADMSEITSDVGERAVGAAAASANERKNNLLDSLRMTAQHPLFGVGVGNFAVVQNDEAIAAGRPKGSWLGTHNTYTQLSSECGIPVLICFLAILAASIRSLRSARRLAARSPSPLASEVRKAAEMTEILMWGTFVFIFFSHIGYDMTIYLLVSLCTVLERASGTGTLENTGPNPVFSSMSLPVGRHVNIPACVGFRPVKATQARMPVPRR